MRTLLITSGLNSDKNSSWLVFSKLIKTLIPIESISLNIICFTPALIPSPLIFGEKAISTILRDKIITATFNRISRKYSWWIAKFYSQIYWKKVLKIIKNKQIERLWIDTDVLSILILKKIIDRVNIPFHITVYDDPFTNRFYAPFKLQFEPVLRDIFRCAKSIDTPTLMLGNHYHDTGIVSKECIIAESLVGTFKKLSKSPDIRQNIEKICLAGSIYGIDALNSFLEAIRDKIVSKEVEFHLRTTVPKLYLKYIEKNFPIVAKSIIIKPFIPENELAEKLQEYDLLYLPMMFDEKYRFKTNTSFPSKTHNYLASGVPIIVHTPESSSLDLFFKDNNIGCIINTLDINIIRDKYLWLQNWETRSELSKGIEAFNAEKATNTHVNKLFDVIST